MGPLSLSVETEQADPLHGDSNRFVVPSRLSLPGIPNPTLSLKGVPPSVRPSVRAPLNLRGERSDESSLDVGKNDSYRTVFFPREKSRSRGTLVVLRLREINLTLNGYSSQRLFIYHGLTLTLRKTLKSRETTSP